MLVRGFLHRADGMIIVNGNTKTFKKDSDSVGIWTLNESATQNQILENPEIQEAYAEA